MKAIDSYNEILNVLNKHDDLLNKNYSIDIRSRLKSLIKSQEIANKFNIDLGYGAFEGSDTYVKLGDYSHIAHYSKEFNRTISWSDDGRQPENEWLYVISFPTGAYIFGEDYPVSIFNDFFVELKSYNPKYSDTHNNNLYYCEKTASEVHSRFKEILEKYRLLAKDEIKQIRIKELENKLSKLKEQ